jgi:hypothetical protein
VLTNLILLLILAGLAGASALVLFSVLGRVESRAHWGREKGLARSRRLERRAFVIGVSMVVAMAAVGLTLYLNRTPPCKGKIVIVKGPNGAPLACVCEQEKQGACFDPGP